MYPDLGGGGGVNGGPSGFGAGRFTPSSLEQDPSNANENINKAANFLIVFT